MFSSGFSVMTFYYIITKPPNKQSIPPKRYRLGYRYIYIHIPIYRYCAIILFYIFVGNRNQRVVLIIYLYTDRYKNVTSELKF